MASTIQSVKEGKLSKNSSDDRISNLPKPVLLHILSFLSTKEAAATSVLSKPWQHLWTWVPDLDISDFVAHDTRSFIRVIFRIFLSRREWCIRKLVLSFHLYCDVVTLHNILCTAVERNVEEIHLFLGCCALLDEVFELPHSLFSCKTLMVLRLEGEIAINLGCSFHLPSLEVLHLKMVRYKDEDTFSNLLSACPVLEELLLHLSDRVTDNCLHYEISSHTIKYLALGFYGFSAPSLSNVTVDAPALKHFTIDNGSGPNVLLSNDSTEIKELEDEFAILKEKYRRVRKKTKKNTALLKLMYQQLRNTNPDMPAFESSSDSDH